jgi:hypothetical protein
MTVNSENSETTLARESILEDPQIRASVEAGLAESAAGEAVYIGSFAKYLVENETK